MIALLLIGIIKKLAAGAVDAFNLILFLVATSLNNFVGRAHAILISNGTAIWLAHEV